MGSRARTGLVTQPIKGQAGTGLESLAGGPSFHPFLVSALGEDEAAGRRRHRETSLQWPQGPGLQEEMGSPRLSKVWGEDHWALGRVRETGAGVGARTLETAFSNSPEPTGDFSFSF